MATVTETETDTEVRAGSPPAKLKRHIVKRVPGGVEDQTLCGQAWDRINPASGEMCEPCVEEYRRIRPGWPLPGGAS